MVKEILKLLVTPLKDKSSIAHEKENQCTMPWTGKKKEGKNHIFPTRERETTGY